jgi:hypothetical protein
MIADHVPGAVYCEVNSGGHIPFIEKPNETATLAIDFPPKSQVIAGRAAIKYPDNGY